MARIQPSLLERLAKAKAELDAAQERYDQLAQIARDTLSMGEHTAKLSPFVGVKVQVSPNRTWNKKKALESYGDDICTMQVDLTKARKKLTGDEFDAFYVEGAPKITVTFLHDGT